MEIQQTKKEKKVYRKLSDERLKEIITEAISEFKEGEQNMNVSQCADFLQVCRQTVLNRIKAGIIQAEKIGGSYIINRKQFIKQAS